MADATAFRVHELKNKIFSSASKENGDTSGYLPLNSYIHKFYRHLIALSVENRVEDRGPAYLAGATL